MSHFTVLVVDTKNEKSVDEWMEPNGWNHSTKV